MELTDRRKNGVAHWCAAGIVALYVLVLWIYFVPAFYALADEHGYLVTAKAIALTGGVEKKLGDLLEFSGETMAEVRPGVFVLAQPPGYAVVCAGAYKVGGEGAVFWVNPICGVLTLWGLYLLGRKMAGAVGGVVAVGVMAFQQVFILYSLKALSHGLETCAGVWAIYFAWRYWEAGGVWRAAIAGLIVAGAVSNRLTAGLLVLPVAYALWERGRGRGVGEMWKGVVAAGGAFLLGVVPLLVYQWREFGGILRSGYGAFGGASRFGLGYLVGHLPVVLGMLFEPGVGLFLVFGLALAAPFLVWKLERGKVILLLLWVVPAVLVYAGYFETHGGNLLLYARFFVADFPGIILLAVLGLVWAMGRWPRGRVLMVLVVAASVSYGMADAGVARELGLNADSARLALTVAGAVRRESPAGSGVIVDGDLAYFLDYVDGWGVYPAGYFDAEWVKRRVGDLGKGVPQFDVRRTRELERLVGGRSQGELDEILRGRVRESLGRGRKVGLVASGTAVGGWERRLGDRFVVRLLRETEVGMREGERLRVYGVERK